MDWGEELEARTPGGSSSSQSRGLVMTLLAVDKRKVFLYFLSLWRRFSCKRTTSSGMVWQSLQQWVDSFWRGWIHEVICRHLAVDDPSLFFNFGMLASPWLWCLPSAKGWWPKRCVLRNSLMQNCNRWSLSLDSYMIVTRMINLNVQWCYLQWRPPPLALDLSIITGPSGLRDVITPSGYRRVSRH